jgi:rhodanese-related sulfurtransferase
MRHLTADGLATFFLLHPRAKVLDVRFAYEREAGLLRGDHHVPWYTPDWEPNPGFLDQVLQHLAPEDDVLVICHGGHRSCEAAALLETAGFEHVYNLLGGYEDITEARQAYIPADDSSLLLYYRRA